MAAIALARDGLLLLLRRVRQSDGLSKARGKSTRRLRVAVVQTRQALA